MLISGLEGLHEFLKPRPRPSPIRALSLGPGISSRLSALDTRALVVSVVIFAGLAAYRFYSYWMTGFFVSDEYGYFYDAVQGLIYSDRWFFCDVNSQLFQALGIKSVDAFSYLLPFYIFFWSAATLFLVFKTLRLLSFDSKTIALSLVSSFFLISFVLLSLGFLTEPVGLTMAMLGIYFLARFRFAKGRNELLACSLLSACAFGAATGTREPYSAFLIAGMLIVPAIVIRRPRDASTSRRDYTLLQLASVILFVVPAVFFILVPFNFFNTQLAPITGIFINQFITGRTATPTSEIIINTFRIFFGGIALGWGPIAFGIGMVGFLILLRASRNRREGYETSLFMLVVSLVSLGSYLVVSYIYAPAPGYFSFQNYSTIIRFSDTAVPAYFLLAPVALSRVVSSRRRLTSLAAVFVIFLVAAVPAYQTFASSNLPTVGSGSPFALGYRTPAATIRDYIAANPQGAPYYVAGLPYGWTLTPGVQDLNSVTVYSLVPFPPAQVMNYSTFASLHWTSFYVYSDTPQSPAAGLPPFLAVLFGQKANQTYPYTLTSSEEVLQGPAFAFFHVTISWNGAQ